MLVRPTRRSHEPRVEPLRVLDRLEAHTTRRRLYDEYAACTKPGALDGRGERGSVPRRARAILARLDDGGDFLPRLDDAADVARPAKERLKQWSGAAAGTPNWLSADKQLQPIGERVRAALEAGATSPAVLEALARCLSAEEGLSQLRAQLPFDTSSAAARPSSSSSSSSSSSFSSAAANLSLIHI